MEKKEMNDATGNRRLLPPLYPGSPITTNATRAGNSDHQNYSRSRPFQDSPAATAHFASQAGSFSYQQPPSLLSQMTHASAGVGGSSNAASQDTVSGSGSAAGSSYNQAPPSLLSQIHWSGGVSGGVVDGGNFARDASQVALAGYSCYQMPTPSSLAPMALDPVPMLGAGHANFVSSPDAGGLASVVGRAPSRSCTQSPLSWSVDQASPEFGLSAPLLTQSTASIDFGLTDLQGSGGHLNSSARDRGKTPCPPQPHPYYSDYTCIITQAPSSSMPTPVANFGVKKEAVDWSQGTSQLGKNIITSGGSPSPWTAQPCPGNTDLMVFERKPNQLPSPPLIADFADGLFTQDDIEKIEANKDLSDLVATDPKSVRTTLRRRSASERSRQKKMARLADLERLVPQLQLENKLLSAQVLSQQRTNVGLTSEKNGILIKLYELEQEIQLGKDLNKTLTDEVHRLKVIAGEITGPHVSNSSYQERSPQMMPPEDQPKTHNHQLAQLQRDPELRDFDNFFMQ